MIEATDHSLADDSFIEVEFYPSFLNGHRITLFIHRGEIAAIIILERGKDISLIGFKEAK
jgi:hypothetical protein